MDNLIHGFFYLWITLNHPFTLHNKGGLLVQSIEDIWQETLQIVKKNMSKPSYDTWMKSTTAHSLEGNTFIISAPNNFVRDWLEKKATRNLSLTFCKK